MTVIVTGDEDEPVPAVLTPITPEERVALGQVDNLSDKEFPVTTMVTIFQLEGNPGINEEVAFHLMRVEPIEPPKYRKNPKTTKLKDLQFFMPGDGKRMLVRGSLVAIRHEGKTRGLQVSDSRRHLKNSASFDMIIDEHHKHINTKLSSTRVHMCGPRTQEQAIFALQVILEQLHDINELILYVREEEDKRQRALEWCKEVLRGAPIFIPVMQDVTYIAKRQRYARGTKNVTIQVQRGPGAEVVTEEIGLTDLRSMEKNNWSFPRIVTTKETGETTRYTNIVIAEQVGEMPDHKLNLDALNNNVPADIDPRCLFYFTANTREHASYQSWLTEVEFLNKLNPIYERRPTRAVLQSALVNFNFGIGFPINRARFKEVFTDHPHFVTDYDNMRTQNIFVSLPYYSKDTRICRKKSFSLITFIVYQTGRVTLTGPHVSLNRVALIAFMDHVKANRHKIEQVATTSKEEELFSDSEDVPATTSLGEPPRRKVKLL